MKKIMFKDRFGLTQAVLEGRKTQTRRICKEQIWAHSDIVSAENGIYHFESPKYKVGEVVAVAQKYKDVFESSQDETLELLDLRLNKGWNNKMFVRPDLMPHQIRITDVRVERLQDISDEDCIKEGVELNTRQYEYDGTKYYCVRGLGYWRGFGCTNFHTPREAFANLIDKVSGKGTWERNPYVFVYDFELVK